MGRDNQPLAVNEGSVRQIDVKQPPIQIDEKAIAAANVVPDSQDALFLAGRNAVKAAFDKEQQRLAEEAAKEAKALTGTRRWAALKAGLYGAAFGVVGAAAATFFPVTAAFGSMTLLAAGASAGALVGSTAGYTMTGLDTQKLDSQVHSNNIRMGETLWKAFESAVSERIESECIKHDGKVTHEQLEHALYHNLKIQMLSPDAAREKLGFPVPLEFIEHLSAKHALLRPTEEQEAHITRLEPAPKAPVDVANEEAPAAKRNAGNMPPSSGKYQPREPNMTSETRAEIAEAGREFEQSLGDGPSLRGTRSNAESHIRQVPRAFE